MNLKKWIALIGSLLVIAVVAFFWNNQRPKLVFCGKVVDEKAQPVAGALVEIGKSEARTDKEGGFTIKTTKSDRFVLNVSKLGFGLVSKIYNAPKCDITIAMTLATVTVIETEIAEDPATEPDVDLETAPADAITVEDTTPPPSEPISATIPPNANPLSKVPFVYDASGMLIGFGEPNVSAFYDALEAFQQPQNGAVVTVDPDALEESAEPAVASFFQTKENEKSRKIVASINTIDLYSPDGMPGDFTVTREDNGRGFMKTYGAADVNFYSNGKKLQLKKGKHARIVIPVDTVAQIALKDKLAKTIPILVYDKKTGLWKRDVDKWTGKENTGYLNKERTAYVALVSHFSIFNADDIIFGPSSCIRLCNSSTNSVPANARVEIPSNYNWSYDFGTGCANSATGCGTLEAFGIARATPFNVVGMRLFENMGGGVYVIKHTYAFVTGGTSDDIHDDICSVASTKLGSCTNNPVTLNWSDPSNQNADGSTNGPILAIQRAPGADVNKFNFAWVHIQPGFTTDPVTGDILNPDILDYKIEYAIPDGGDTGADINELDNNWTCIDLDGNPLAPNTFSKRIGDDEAKSWMQSLPGITVKEVSPPALTGNVFFRVLFKKSTDPNYTNGAIISLNPLSGVWASGGVNLNDYPYFGDVRTATPEACTEL